MIYIYPYKQLTANILSSYREEPLPSDYFWKGRQSLFFENGKTAIHHVMSLLKLGREDEVCIFTSTGENYVSTCVTGTIFNYCKISRLVTKKTKMLYIIHEFGLPHPETTKIIALGRRRKIPVVEDCAHTMGSTLNGIMAGNSGDFTVFSMTKHLPVTTGGILTSKTRLNTKSDFYDEEMANKVKKEFYQFFGYYPVFSEARLAIDIKLKTLFKKHNVEYIKSIGNTIPWFTIFKTRKYKEAYRDLSSGLVELGRIYIKNWVAIPTQPLASKGDFDALIKRLPEYF